MCQLVERQGKWVDGWLCAVCMMYTSAPEVGRVKEGEALEERADAEELAGLGQLVNALGVLLFCIHTKWRVQYTEKGGWNSSPPPSRRHHHP